MTAAPTARSVGRPRLYTDKAHKQRAYRESKAKDVERLAALAQIAVDIAHDISIAYENGDDLAFDLVGFNYDETLARLAAYWKQRRSAACEATATAPKPRRAATGKIPAK